MNITESIKFDKLQEENETLKKELAEKDKLISSAESKIESAYENILIEKDKEINEKNEYIKYLENRPENHDCKHCPNREKLYKEDFEKLQYLERDYEGGYILKGEEIRENDPELIEEMLILKDNSKYDTLPSKEDK